MRRVFRQRSEAYFPTHSDVTAVLAAVKAEPWRAREVRGLDGHCARRCLRCAGRDGRMGSAGAEQKDEVRRENGRRGWQRLYRSERSRLGEMLVIDFDRRPEAVKFARARI